MPCFVSLAQIVVHSVTVGFVEFLHNVQSSLAQRLSDGVEEDEDEIRQIP